MKRLVGGDFLLNIATIFVVTSTLTNITNEEDISQLTNLKKFIPNPSMIKPIWVKLHDGDGKLVVTRGSLSVVDSDEFELDVILNGYTLKIHVKFTQMLNENDDPIDDWYIATNDAKYLFTTNNFATFKVENVKNIDGEILSQLKCGDVVIKEDASGEHAYIVSYRGETGICLTYADASVVETQSYDLVDDEWVYNSEDKSKLPINEEDPSFKPIYWHGIELYSSTGGILYFHILNNTPDKINSKDKIIAWITSIPQKVVVQCNGIIMDSGVKKTVYSFYKSENASTINFIIDNPDGVYEFKNGVDLSTYFNNFNDEVNKIN